MKTKIAVFFILTILIPTALLAHFGLLAVRSEKDIVEKNLQRKYEAMAGIVEQEIRVALSGAVQEKLSEAKYWESVLLRATAFFDDEVFLFAADGHALGNQPWRKIEDAAYVKPMRNLPYTIAVYERHPYLKKALEEKERGLVFYVSIIIFSVFSILGGSLLILSALAREWRQAKLKSEFASHLSHDLRRPLTSIRMFSEMLKSGDVPSEEKKREYYGIISDESDKLTLLANNILDFSRIEEGRRRYHIRPEDIGRVVRETVERFRMYTSMETRKVELNIDSGAFPMVKIDAGAITQALMNLLTNADKYSPPDTTITVNLRKRKRAVVIEVIDRGEGIPKAEQKRVFEKFYRAAREDAAEVQGSGLGLALVKFTAKAHRGHVTLESEEGKGSVFAIVLPA